MLSDVVARASDGTLALGYLGSGAEGHYVKMVHNGIEQAMMSGIAEVYELLTTVGHQSPEQLHALFTDWNDAELQSFLVGITAQIVVAPDSKHDNKTLLLDAVDDEVVQDNDESEGTGVWTSKEAAEQLVPAPSITSALFYRLQSSVKSTRVNIASRLSMANGGQGKEGSRLVDAGSSSSNELSSMCRHALYAAYIAAFVQGLDIVSAAKRRYQWHFSISEVLDVWKSGCIIQAKLIDILQSAYRREPDLRTGLESQIMLGLLHTERYRALRRCVLIATAHAIPAPVLHSSLSYFDTATSEHLATSMLEAQLDYFGVHEFFRKGQSQEGGKQGMEHQNWEEQ